MQARDCARTPTLRLPMRKGEDTFAMKRRRMPFVAKIRRDDPFRLADRREIEGMVRRIAASAETFVVAGSRADTGFRLYHFTTWAKARAMQHWIDRSGIANRPMPARSNAVPLGVGDLAL
jgi:hypothetical protein